MIFSLEKQIQVTLKYFSRQETDENLKVVLIFFKIQIAYDATIALM